MPAGTAPSPPGQHGHHTGHLQATSTHPCSLLYRYVAHPVHVGHPDTVVVVLLHVTGATRRDWHGDRNVTHAVSAGSGQNCGGGDAHGAVHVLLVSAHVRVVPPVHVHSPNPRHPGAGVVLRTAHLALWNVAYAPSASTPMTRAARILLPTATPPASAGSTYTHARVLVSPYCGKREHSTFPAASGGSVVVVLLVVVLLVVGGPAGVRSTITPGNARMASSMPPVTRTSTTSPYAHTRDWAACSASPACGIRSTRSAALPTRTALASSNSAIRAAPGGPTG